METVTAVNKIVFEFLALYPLIIAAKYEYYPYCEEGSLLVYTHRVYACLSAHDQILYACYCFNRAITRLFAESDVIDRNATIFFQKACLSSLHDNTRGPISG